jgi:NADPH-dependent 2,4-dienoyl-CoA reductase/sulfur reductase-like enzyme
MRVVIVGAGAAGMSAVETISAHDANVQLSIISKDKGLPYSPVALPEYIEGRISKEQMLLWDEAFCAKRNLDLILGKAVAKVYPNERRIALDDGSVFSYDKLLIASGALPVLPEQLKGRKGVFVLRTMEDAEAIRRQVKERVILYGAGAVATKLAVAFRRMGVDVILICRSRMLRRLFDEDICLIIHDLLTINGVKIIGLHPHVRLSGDPVDRLGVGTQELPCDGVVVALGVSPNTSFVDGQHIRLGASGGIIVNGRMETSAPHVYAAGDCIETNDVTTGQSQVVALWPPAVEQGRIAALNMLGIEAHYEGTLSQNVVDVFGTPFASIGSLDGEKVDRTTGSSISRFTIQKEKIVGCQLVGDISNAGLLSARIKKGMTVRDLELVSCGRLLPVHRAQLVSITSFPEGRKHGRATKQALAKRGQDA